MKTFFSLIVSSVICVLVGQQASAKNLYLQQLNNAPDFQISKDEEKKLVQRIKEFQSQKPYTIKNLPSFHKQNTLDQEPITLCQTCHGNLPHKKNEVSRTFLNQHSQRIDCMTCHFQADGYKLDYRWSKQGRGKNKDKTIREKITPFYQDESVVIPVIADIAKQIKADWKDADLHKKARIHHRVHQPLNFSEEKIKCGDCHKKEGMLNLMSLKFDDEAIQKIETNLISRFLAKLKPENKTLLNSPDDKKQRILLRGLLK